METSIVAVDSPVFQNILDHLTHDVYHLPSYILTEADRLKAQAAAIFISDGSKQFLLPYLLWQCPEELCVSLQDRVQYDVVSPYGYPGILLNEAAQNDPNFLDASLQLLSSTFQSQKICSAFIRLHPILNNTLQSILGESKVSAGGMTVSIDLTLSEQEQWQQMQSSRRTKINRCRRQGFGTTISPFLVEHISAFMDIYQDTMDRLNAKEIYYFDRAYYESLVRLSPHVFVCFIERENNPICAGIFTECCGIVQYHLGCTKTDFLPLSPSNQMFDEVRLWAKARCNRIFHLGGGLGSQQDSLFDFKASFSKQRHHFCTLRLITDSKCYQALIQARAKQMNVNPDELVNSAFFPAYRYH